MSLFVYICFLTCEKEDISFLATRSTPMRPMSESRLGMAHESSPKAIRPQCLDEIVPLPAGQAKVDG